MNKTFCDKYGDELNVDADPDDGSVEFYAEDKFGSEFNYLFTHDQWQSIVSFVATEHMKGRN